MEVVLNSVETAQQLFAVVATLAVLVTGFFVGRCWLRSVADEGEEYHDERDDGAPVFDRTSWEHNPPDWWWEESAEDGERVNRWAEYAAANSMDVEDERQYHNWKSDYEDERERP